MPIEGVRKIVAVDINPATRPAITGTEIFTREVSRRLPASAPDICWRFYASRARAGLGVDVMVLPFPRLWSQVRLPIALVAEKPALLFVPGHAIPFAWKGDVLAVVHDLAFERYPQAYSIVDRAYLRLSTRWAVARCRLLIAISESTRADLIELYGVAPEKIRVVPLGVAPSSTAPAPSGRLAELGLDGTFVLQVGRIEARKNQLTALEAVKRLDGVTFAVAGPERDRDVAGRLRESSRCRVLGMVDPPTLELLYERAGAVIVPSLYEGFGLPVLEAMAHGKVVVAAKSSSLPEVGGDTALYFDPAAGPDQVADLLRAALGDESLRTKLEREGRERASTFTWDATAARIAEIVKELIE